MKRFDNDRIWSQFANSYKYRSSLFFTNNTENSFWFRVKWHFHIKSPHSYHSLNKLYHKRIKNFCLVEHRSDAPDIYTQLKEYAELIDPTHTLYATVIKKRTLVILKFLTSYTTLFYQLIAQDFYIIRSFKKNKPSPLFRLFFTYKTNKLFVTLQNSQTTNLFFISLGFFLKYFQKRKVLKKSKAFKLLLARSLRKFFLLARLRSFFFFVRGGPIYFMEMLKTLNRRIDHAFFNPYDQKLFDESSLFCTPTLLKIPYFFFLKNTPFVPVKTRKQGRIKRKLRRRLVVKNRVAD